MMEDFGYKYYSTKEQFELDIDYKLKLYPNRFLENYASRSWNGHGYYRLLLNYYEGILISENIKDEIDGRKAEIEKLTKRLNELYKIRGENS